MSPLACYAYPPETARLASEVGSPPAAGFDWGGELRLEEVALSVTVQQMAEASGPAEIQQIRGTPEFANLTIPTEAETRAFRELMKSPQESLSLPPAQVQSISDEAQLSSRRSTIGSQQTRSR